MDWGKDVMLGWIRWIAWRQNFQNEGVGRDFLTQRPRRSPRGDGVQQGLAAKEHHRTQSRSRGNLTTDGTDLHPASLRASVVAPLRSYAGRDAGQADGNPSPPNSTAKYADHAEGNFCWAKASRRNGNRCLMDETDGGRRNSGGSNVKS